MPKRSPAPADKISLQFRARLSALADDVAVQAVVLLRVGDGATTRARQSPAVRAAAIQQTQQQAALALAAVDAVLEAHHSLRLSATPNLLGQLSVQATPAAILALAELPHVTAIIEDQALR